MPYKDCLYCKQLGQKPREWKEHLVVFDPRVQMPGTPTLQGHRLSAEFIADVYLHRGMKETMADYSLPRDAVLAACWWAGNFGPRQWRARWRGWASDAGNHLWYGCRNFPDPPQKGAA